MNKELLLEIINNNDEREWVEFKTNYPAEKHAQDIGEYISALSNSATLHKQNYAYLIWGVENNTRKIIGTDFKYDLDINGSEVFKHYLARNLSPRIVFEFEEAYIDDKRLVVLTIPAAKNNITEFKQERYIRIGSSKELLRKYPNHEAKLWKLLNNEEITIVEKKARRQNLTFEVLKIYLNEHKVSFTNDNFDETFELRNAEGFYNEMAYLLSDQFNESVKVCRFKGDGGNLVLRQEFGRGCLFKIYNDVKDYMRNQVNIPRTYFDHGQRRDEFLYDEVSFVEAWKNAILHNNYVEEQYPAIYLFDDHLEVFSNGNPLKNVTIDEFLRGKSRPINRALTKIAMNIDITDQTGKGNKDIVKEYGPDAFEISENLLTVKIPYNPLALNHEYVNDAKNDAKNDGKTLEEKIIDLIQENNKITKVIMAEKTGVSKATIERCIKSSSKIFYVGSKKGGHWEVKE